ncbi:MAG: glycosyltransferase family 39 protein [Microthrixaceae bacterium]
MSTVEQPIDGRDGTDAHPSDERSPGPPTVMTKWQRKIAAVWAIGLAIRLWDVFAYRPGCVPGEFNIFEGNSCYNLTGDAAGFFGAAHLVRLGEVGMNPLLYNVTGGRLVSTASKPPLGVAWLALIGWLGDSPWVGQTIVSALLIGAAYVLVKRYAGRARALLTAEIGVALYLALRIFGGTTLTSARVYSVLLGSLAVPLMASVGRRAAPNGWGERVGLITALVVAIHPAIWVGDSMLNNETVLVVVMPLFLLATYRTLERPTTANWLALGTTLVLLVLTRVELAGLGLLVVPFVWWRATDNRRARLHGAAALGITVVVLLGIYTGWNRLRLGGGSPGPVSVVGYVLNAGSCDQVFSGEGKGLWYPCWANPQTAVATAEDERVADVVDRIVDHPGYADQLTDPDVGVLGLTETPPPVQLFDGYEQLSDIRRSLIDNYGQLPDGSLGVGIWLNGRPTADPDAPVSPGDEVRFRFHFYFLMTDEPLTAATLTPPTMEYLSDHRSELPGVMAARLGRITGLYQTSNTMVSDQVLESHGWFPSRFGFLGLWLQLPCAIAGTIVLARARRPLAPLLGPIINVALVTAAVFGLARYRLSADLTIAVLAATGLVAAGRWAARRPWRSLSRPSGG